MRKSTLLFAGLLLALFALVATPGPTQVAGFEAESSCPPMTPPVCVIAPVSGHQQGSGGSGNGVTQCNSRSLGCTVCCDENHCGGWWYQTVGACGCSDAGRPLCSESGSES